MRTTVSVARATLLLCVLAVLLCALRTSSLRVLCPVPAADPVLPNSASVARAAVSVTSCLTAAVSHAVPRWVAHLGLPSAPACPGPGAKVKTTAVKDDEQPQQQQVQQQQL